MAKIQLPMVKMSKRLITWILIQDADTRRDKTKNVYFINLNFNKKSKTGREGEPGHLSWIKNSRNAKYIYFLFKHIASSAHRSIHYLFIWSWNVSSVSLEIENRLKNRKSLIGNILFYSNHAFLNMISAELENIILDVLKKLTNIKRWKHSTSAQVRFVRSVSND